MIRLSKTLIGPPWSDLVEKVCWCCNTNIGESWRNQSLLVRSGPGLRSSNRLTVNPDMLGKPAAQSRYIGIDETNIDSSKLM